MQVCFGQYQTQLHFERDLRISVESDVEHKGPTGLLGRSLEGHYVVSSLTQLLGSTIERVIVEDGKAILLRFRNGHSVRLSADDPLYECFEIVSPE